MYIRELVIFASHGAQPAVSSAACEDARMVGVVQQICSDGSVDQQLFYVVLPMTCCNLKLPSSFMLKHDHVAESEDSGSWLALRWQRALSW